MTAITTRRGANSSQRWNTFLRFLIKYKNSLNKKGGKKNNKLSRHNNETGDSVWSKWAWFCERNRNLNIPQEHAWPPASVTRSSIHDVCCAASSDILRPQTYRRGLCDAVTSSFTGNPLAFHFLFSVVCKRRQSQLIVLFVFRYHRAAETDGSTTSLHWKDTSPPLFIFNLFLLACKWHRRHCHNIIVSVYYKAAN